MWKRILSIWLYAGFCICELGCSDESSDNTEELVYFEDSDTWDPRFEVFVKALEFDLENSEAYGISAAVMEGGEITFAAALGSRDAEGQTPLTADTLMQIGSTTKQMTAVALLRTVDQGKISLETSIDSVLPQLEFSRMNDWDNTISIHYLLSHQSGIVDWATWIGASDDGALASYSYDTFNKHAYVMNSPGLFYNYSNSNFALAALVTEALDKRTWPDVLTEDVFLPLGMERTFIRKAKVKEDANYSLSFGFHPAKQDQPMMNVNMKAQSDSAWMRPAGLVWTTPKQMMTWAKFIMQGDKNVLSDELRDKMMQKHATVYPELDISHYGYGLFVDSGFQDEAGNWYNTPVIQHGGNTLSFSHAFYMLPEYDFAVSICSSTFGHDLSHSILTALTKLIDIEKSPDPPNFEPDPARFERHVGVYNDPWLLGDVTVTKEGNKLLIDIPDAKDQGLPVERELIPLIDGVFFMTINGEKIDISFIGDSPDGPSAYIRSRFIVAVRK